ncbi:MAG: hemN [Chitinophagaceae bacterium]|nr:hemN [Chitinophagaceae bacterium]
MVHALVEELKQRKNFLTTIDTIYFGGGTPSVLSNEELILIFSVLHDHYSISSLTEITLEANPDDINDANLSLWLSCGINRLSIGCQTFDDAILTQLNRVHRSVDSMNAFQLARDKGFNNISIDLMFGLPDQDVKQWTKDLEMACSLKPEHISAYGLTIEDNTVFGSLAKKGRLSVPGEEQQASYYEQMMQTLLEKGYEQYEISNFSLPSYKSKHNSSYWNQEKYLGIGPSAHSFDGENRMWNDSNNMTYIKKIESGQIAYSTEALSSMDRTNEYILTAIRTKEGIDVQRLIHEFNYPTDQLNEILRLLTPNGWIEETQEQIFLTTSGKLLADEITLKFFLN